MVMSAINRVRSVGGIKAGIPTARIEYIMTYDAANNRLTMLNGFSFAGIFYDAWVLTGANGL